MIRYLRSTLLAALLSCSGGALASQGSGCMPTSGTVSGLAFSAYVTSGLAALISSNSGASAPATDCSLAPVQGQWWLDTSTGTPALKMYDGTSWLMLGRLDLANHIWTPVVGGGASSVASASTTDLCSVPQAALTVTGTTTITGFGSTCVVGQVKLVSFSDVLTLTNSGTLVLPTGANITTAAGDRAVVSQLSSGTWAVFSYQRADGSALYASGVYSGELRIFAMNSCPATWVAADGGTVSRTGSGAALFAALGTLYGVGDGVTTFNVPDMRGVFPRGYDGGRGLDTSTLSISTTSGSSTVTVVGTGQDTTQLYVGAILSGSGIPGGTTVQSITDATHFVMSANASATASPVTITVTRPFGSYQPDELQDHTHNTPVAVVGIGGQYIPTSGANSSNTASTVPISGNHGAETRPKNLAVKYCVKL